MTREEWLLHECRSLAQFVDALIYCAGKDKATEAKGYIKNGIEVPTVMARTYFEARLCGAPKE